MKCLLPWPPRKPYLVKTHELVGGVVARRVEAGAVGGNGAVGDERREELPTPVRPRGHGEAREGRREGECGGAVNDVSSAAKDVLTSLAFPLVQPPAIAPPYQLTIFGRVKRREA